MSFVLSSGRIGCSLMDRFFSFSSALPLRTDRVVATPATWLTVPFTTPCTVRKNELHTRAAQHVHYKRAPSKPRAPRSFPHWICTTVASSEPRAPTNAVSFWCVGVIIGCVESQNRCCAMTLSSHLCMTLSSVDTVDRSLSDRAVSPDRSLDRLRSHEPGGVD